MKDARAGFYAATSAHYRGAPSNRLVSYPDRKYYGFELTWRDEDVRALFKSYFEEEPFDWQNGGGNPAGPVPKRDFATRLSRSSRLTRDQV